MPKSLLAALLFTVFSMLHSGLVDAQTRIPGWNRVAPPGGHQNDPQMKTAPSSSALVTSTPILKRFLISPSDQVTM